MKTVLIADDEQDARTLLKEYVADIPDFNLLGEANHGLEAVEKINALRPDVVFLDIQMPGYTGFEVLTKLDYLPEVIFSTAYDRYAIDAFNVQALDYLLKPYGKQRFLQAVQKLESNKEKVERLAEKLLEERSSQRQKMILHSGRKRVIIDINRIDYLEAYGDYTKVYTREEELLSTSGISTMLEQLPVQHFIRIHRSFAINLDNVDHLAKEGRYHFVTLNSGKALKVSESFLPMLKSLYG